MMSKYLCVSRERVVLLSELDLPLPRCVELEQSQERCEREADDGDHARCRGGNESEDALSLVGESGEFIIRDGTLICVADVASAGVMLTTDAAPVPDRVDRRELRATSFVSKLRARVNPEEVRNQPEDGTTARSTGYHPCVRTYEPSQTRSFHS